MNDNYDHLGVMKNPGHWPKWPVLPIKNKTNRKPGEFPKLAVLVELGLNEQNPDIRFVEGNMFMINEAEIRNAPKADPEKLVAEGWVVD